MKRCPDTGETGKADDKVSISQRIVDFLLCQTPPENAKPTPKGSACTSPDKWDALGKAAEAATPGPWRVRKKINNDERDRTKITDIRWEIGAGTQTEPKQNKGHFHPEDEWYTSDETSVVETSMDRDYNDYEGGIGKQEDATFIALANPAAILELLSEMQHIEHTAWWSGHEAGRRGMERGGEGTTLSDAMALLKEYRTSHYHTRCIDGLPDPCDLCKRRDALVEAHLKLATLSVTEGSKGTL